MYYHYTHFINEKTEAQKGYNLAQITQTLSDRARINILTSNDSLSVQSIVFIHPPVDGLFLVSSVTDITIVHAPFCTCASIPLGSPNQRCQEFFILTESAKLPSKNRLTYLHSGGAFPLPGLPKSSEVCIGGGEHKRQSVTHQTPAKEQVPRRTAPPPGRVEGGCDGSLPTKPAAHSFVYLSPESVGYGTV